MAFPRDNPNSLANLRHFKRGAVAGQPRPVPEDVEVDTWSDGLVTVGPMSRILGVNRQNIENLAKRGRIPFEVHSKMRWFNVDRVMKWVMEMQIRIPPLNEPNSTEADDFRWAWNALSLSPARCCVAPSGRAWRVYLDARDCVQAKTRLTGMFAKLAAKQMGLEVDPRRVPRLVPRDREGEKNQPLTIDEVVKAEEAAAESADEPLLPPTPAEVALKALDDDQVAGPFAFDGEGY